MEEVGARTVPETLNLELSSDILERIETFGRLKGSPKEILFFELCYCILTANTSAELGLKMQKEIGTVPFIEYDLSDLRNALKLARYRFYNTRSRYIFNSRWIMEELPSLVNAPDPFEARQYLVDNVYGIGYKEASHFLRNVGVFDLAILDKHILRVLDRHFSIRLPRTMTPRKYLEIEREFIKISESYSMKPGVFDLVLWKNATGKVLK